MTQNTDALHTIKDYKTEKDSPICLHENRFFKMMFNGYFHYLDPVKYALATAVVPLFKNGDVLLVKLRRVPCVGFSMEFPRGGADQNETMEKAALRELGEETGFWANESCLKRLGKIVGDSGTLNSFMDVYQVNIPDSVTQGEFDTDEIEKPIRVSRTDFEAMIKNNEIVDGITLSSWALYLAHNT